MNGIYEGFKQRANKAIDNDVTNEQNKLANIQTTFIRQNSYV